MMIQSSIVHINFQIKGKIFLLRGFLIKKFRKKLRTCTPQKNRGNFTFPKKF